MFGLMSNPQIVTITFFLIVTIAVECIWTKFNTNFFGYLWLLHNDKYNIVHTHGNMGTWGIQSIGFDCGKIPSTYGFTCVTKVSSITKARSICCISWKMKKESTMWTTFTLVVLNYSFSEFGLSHQKCDLHVVQKGENSSSQFKMLGHKHTTNRPPPSLNVIMFHVFAISTIRWKYFFM
jgi:hypothetical protein